MKFLHLADLHLGKRVNGFDLLEDQRFILEQVLGLCDAQGVEAVLLAGDIYDAPVPPAAATTLLDWFLTQLAARRIPVLAISGNHDSPDRIAVGKSLLARHGIHIITELKDAFTPVEIGNIQIFPLPYFENAQMRDFLGDETLRGAGACMRAAVEKMEKAFDPAKKHVLVAHCFAAGASTSDSESRIFVGGAGDVPTDVFSPFDYAALGHLHAAQRAGDTARYAGSPLKYSVDEAHQKKSMTLVTLGDTVETTCIPVTPLHDVKRIEGTFAALLENGQAVPNEDYVEILLTDDEPVFRPADRLRPYYPNVLGVRSTWFLKQHAGTQAEADLHSRSRAELFRGFLKEVCGEEAQPEDEALLAEILKELEGDAT